MRLGSPRFCSRKIPSGLIESDLTVERRRKPGPQSKSSWSLLGLAIVIDRKI
jgi:hypothetical protein